jgi:hypothetical protein
LCIHITHTDLIYVYNLRCKQVKLKIQSAIVLQLELSNSIHQTTCAHNRNVCAPAERYHVSSNRHGVLGAGAAPGSRCHAGPGRSPHGAWSPLPRQLAGSRDPRRRSRRPHPRLGREPPRREPAARSPPRHLHCRGGQSPVLARHRASSPATAIVAAPIARQAEGRAVWVCGGGGAAEEAEGTSVGPRSFVARCASPVWCRRTRGKIISLVRWCRFRIVKEWFSPCFATRR